MSAINYRSVGVTIFDTSPGVTPHEHKYKINVDGNGWTEEACDPDFPFICHSHEIVEFDVHPGGSDDEFPKRGLPLHVHSLQQFDGEQFDKANESYIPGEEGPLYLATHAILSNSGDGNAPIYGVPYELKKTIFGKRAQF